MRSQNRRLPRWNRFERSGSPHSEQQEVVGVHSGGRRRVLAVSGAFLAAVAAVLAVVLPLSGSVPAAAPARADTAKTGVVPAGGGGRLAGGSGDTVCGDVRFDRSRLPGRTATPANGDWPTAPAADLLRLHGWPRAVPFDVAHWTVVLNGDAGVLVAFLPGSGFHYLPIRKAAGGGWSVGPPCTPR
jgi:hypothetical protein